jgi:uncharacterized protein (TIGR02172 family)
MTDLGPQIAKGRTADVFLWGERQIVKLYRREFPPTAIDREVAQARLAHAAGIRTPVVHDVVTLRDRRGIIFERVEGPTMLGALGKNPGTFDVLARELAVLHVSVHSCQQPEFPELHSYLTRAITHATDLADSEKASVLAILDRLPRGDAICHGDFQPGNVIMSVTGSTLVDWSHAASGDAIADVAHTALMLNHTVLSHPVPPNVMERIASVRSAFCTAYLREYAKLRAVPSDRLRAWTLPVTAARLSYDLSDSQRSVFVSLLRELLANAA